MTDQQDVNALVAMLVPDAAHPPDLAVLNGYIGPSTVDGCVRLYRSSAMNIWLDIPKDQIKGRSTIGPNSKSPGVEDIIWMRRVDAVRLRENRSTKPDEPSGGPRSGYPHGHLYPPKA
jgi:hypothetical protein